MTPEQFRLWRARRGISQAAAATLIGVGLATLKAWEHGRTGVPEPVARLTRALDHIELLTKGFPKK